MSKPICFISDKNYRWMSNFYYASIHFDQTRVFPTVEHGYQYFKTNDVEWRKRIRMAGSPKEAKRLGRQCPMRNDWEDIKVEVMKKLVRLKFLQHPDLRDKLVATGSRSIQEDSPWDGFWGTGPGGRGKNMMGKILAEVRSEWT